LSEADSTPQLGQVVRVTKGRDVDKYAVIIKILDNRFVLIADGDKRKYDRPKKKNLHHIALMDYISLEINNSLLETGRVTNGKLRFTIAKFESEVVNDFKKGDQLNG